MGNSSKSSLLYLAFYKYNHIAVAVVFLAHFHNGWVSLWFDMNNLNLTQHVSYCHKSRIYMMTSSNGNIFRVTGPLCGEFTGHRWIPPYKGQWRGAFMFALICAWTNGRANNRDAGGLRRYRAHYDVIVLSRMIQNLIMAQRHPQPRWSAMRASHAIYSVSNIFITAMNNHMELVTEIIIN